MSDASAVPQSPLKLLNCARDAWGRFRRAESELARLAKYARPNPQMKSDIGEWRLRRSQAEADLAHALRSDSGATAS